MSATMDVLNPATEEVIGTVPDCGVDEVDAAVAAYSLEDYTQIKHVMAKLD